MEALTAQVARLLAWLNAMNPDAVCPGGWPWAVSLLGVAVGLLPAAGAGAVALWRRRRGSRYGLGGTTLLVLTGVFTAGLAPLALFRATGSVFAAAAADDPVTGLTARQLRNLDTAVCLVGPQSRYLGAGRVVDAFGGTGPVRAGLAVLALVGMPVVAALFTGVSARLANRRGPRWPVRLFWLPLLAVAVLTGDVPPGSAGHLWFGAAAGAFLGMPLVAMVGPPDWAVVQRSTATGRLAELRRSGAGGPAGRPASATGQGRAGQGSAGQGSAGQGGAGWACCRWPVRPRRRCGGAGSGRSTAGSGPPGWSGSAC